MKPKSSVLMPSTSVTTYAIPTDDHPRRDQLSKARRVQQQVQQRMAEKSSSSSRLNASTEFDGHTSTVRYQTKTPGFSSKSVINNGNRTMATPRLSQYAGEFSSRSAVEMGTRHRISHGVPMPAVVGRPYMYHDDAHLSGSYNQMQTLESRTLSRAEQEAAAMAGLTLQRQSSPVGNWVASYGSSPNVVQRQRTLSGTLAREGYNTGWRGAELANQYSFKGPSHRTISRINNRQVQQQQQQRLSSSSMQWQQMSTGGTSMMGAGHYQGTMKRAGSVHSMKSVGRGVDVYDGLADGTTDAFGGIHNLDMTTAISYISSTDVAMQMLGAAYIQHQCYHSNEAKTMVRSLKGISALVQLFSSENQEVQRYATGATRNLIYENMDNKTALIEAGGISKLIGALREPDDELQKNITGILWNLSSKDSLKERLAREGLSELTERVLVPLSGRGDAGVIQQSASEADIFYNTTGCLRNLSSVNERTRQQMRETRGLVDSLVGYIENSLQEGKGEDKRNQDLTTFSEVARVPKGAEWLWHPKIVALYNRILQSSETNTATREAAAGALQNITAGDSRWASVLCRVALEQERMLPVILDLLRSPTDAELRSLTGLLRNLSRHCKNKADMATKVVNILVNKLPSDGHQKEPSSDVVVNICGVLNYLVTGSSLAARDITYFDGLPKLVSIKTSHDNSPGKLKAARAATTVLSNMFQYTKLHKDYKQKGFTKRDFTDMAI
uniref:Plakophilin-3-like n=1 Tax=Sinocyclocheilus anshuiensis TaxID=1608454 RepID=A0A671KLS2_9TELE